MLVGLGPAGRGLGVRIRGLCWRGSGFHRTGTVTISRV